MEKFYSDFLQSRRKSALDRHLRPVTPLSARKVSVDGQVCINFSGNDYLGLKNHPALIERSREWTQRFGAGSGASRLVCGNLDIFEGIEEKTARLKNREAALVLASGFQANATLLPALFDRSVLKDEPLVFSDRLNHASIHHGCAAAGVRQIRYNHLDYDHLRALMEKHCDGKRPAFILTETVFSMDGDTADLSRLATKAKKFGAMLIVDEAHATGVMGQNGAGLAAQYPDVAIVMGTFSKALGSFGAYIACSNVMRDYLINRCAGLIYSTALPPGVLGAIDAALDVAPMMEKERAHLQALSAQLRRALDNLGVPYGASQSQIVPAILGDAEKTLELARVLEQKGFLGVAIRPPSVPVGESRIRFSLSAAHDENDVTRLAEAFEDSLVKRKAA